MGKRVTAVGMGLLLAVAACGGEPAPEPSPGRSPSCSAPVGQVDAPDAGYRVVAGVAAVPGDRILQAGSSGESEPSAKLFAKWGLLVRTGETIEVSVESGRALVGWGKPAVPAASVRITACPEGSRPRPWAAFAGGTWVAEPACVPLVIRAGDNTERVRIPVGVACG
jgi:hypothetical protein